MGIARAELAAYCMDGCKSATGSPFCIPAAAGLVIFATKLAQALVNCAAEGSADA